MCLLLKQPLMVVHQSQVKTIPLDEKVTRRDAKQLFGMFVRKYGRVPSRNEIRILADEAYPWRCKHNGSHLRPATRNRINRHLKTAGKKLCAGCLEVRDLSSFTSSGGARIGWCDHCLYSESSSRNRGVNWWRYSLRKELHDCLQRYVTRRTR